ncbi:hypothetical protein [Halomonas sp.]|uniref:hypothetical protein n=1 Tax=Halomonas sp. TaxID=1486246 RepID=UPI003D0D2FDB
MTILHETPCPICEAGLLVPQTAKNEVIYQGHTRTLPLLMWGCATCGSEQASAQQACDNKRAMLAFRKEVDGLLTEVIHGS